MLSSFRPILIALLWTVVHSGNAIGEERVALIVGNSDYQHATKLPNPGRDAAALSATFRRLGYKVIEAENLSAKELNSRIQSFLGSLDQVEVAVFFYAGHGLQVNGKNFLLPIDFDLSRKEDLKDKMVQLDTIIEGMSMRARSSLVFLDACRNNPFAEDIRDQLSRGVTVPLEARGIEVVGTGLAEMKGRVGTLIGYATQPGNVASDGLGRNSPFTTGLLKNLEQPGLEVRELLTKVRASVVAETHSAQIPWDHSSLLENFYIKKKPRRPIVEP